mmetsp:Transcript_29558/g.84268  ORF Transcript_29558/g.84268 Transcript_29558/m.84268 type:complete len:352 (-) Transcript_29558:159-1214(-)
MARRRRDVERRRLRRLEVRRHVTVLPAGWPGVEHLGPGDLYERAVHDAATAEDLALEVGDGMTPGLRAVPAPALQPLVVPRHVVLRQPEARHPRPRLPPAALAVPARGRLLAAEDGLRGLPGLHEEHALARQPLRHLRRHHGAHHAAADDDDVVGLAGGLGRATVAGAAAEAEALVAVVVLAHPDLDRVAIGVRVVLHVEAHVTVRRPPDSPSAARHDIEGLVIVPVAALPQLHAIPVAAPVVADVDTELGVRRPANLPVRAAPYETLAGRRLEAIPQLQAGAVRNLTVPHVDALSRVVRPTDLPLRGKARGGSPQPPERRVAKATFARHRWHIGRCVHAKLQVCRGLDIL